MAFAVIPVLIYSSDNVFVNPSMTVMSKGESETVEVEVGPVTNVYMVEGRRLKTNDLFEAKKVLESLMEFFKVNYNNFE
jgi:hypothetical protein